MSLRTSKSKTFATVTVEKVNLSRPRTTINDRTPHGDEQFIRAANSAIDTLMEYEWEYIEYNYSEKKWRKIIQKLRDLSLVDKQGFIYYYLKINGIKDISDIGEGYFDLLEAQGILKSRRTWPKGC